MRGRPKQKKPDDVPWNKQWDFVFLFHWIQKWLFLLLAQPQMVFVFLGNFIAFFNVLEAQDWWCLLHLEDLYNIRKVGIIEKYNKALLALDKYHRIINELPSKLNVLLNTFAHNNEIYCPENICFLRSCFVKVKIEVCLSSIFSTTAAFSVAIYI